MKEISVAITAHDEGLLAHKTMQSVFRALKQLPQDTDYEILVHIDNGDRDTTEYFNRYQDDPHIRIFQNQLADLGASRNFCANHADGKYLFFIDADDLMSENFLRSALEVLHSAQQDTVVHPEFYISFWENGRRLISRTVETHSREEAAFYLFPRNQWPSPCGAKREIFQNHPYILTKDGFGHEDFAFYIDTAAHNIQHLTAPGAVDFYRQKPQSLLRTNNFNHVTQPYSDLFDIQLWQKLDLSSLNPTSQPLTFRQALRRAYVAARNNRALNTLITPAATLAKKVTGKKLIPSALPDIVLNEWRKISQIETALYPTTESVRKLEYWAPNTDFRINIAYQKLCAEIKDYADYIFIVPWLVSGGADKVVLNYLTALREIHPDWRIAVVTTIPSDNPWKSRMPDNAFLVDFGNIAHDLDEGTRDHLFTRLIIQLRAKKLHIIGSLYGLEWASTHRGLVAGNYQLDVSLFCYDVIPNTNGQGHFDYADPYALRIYPLIRHIYTDNSANVDRLEALNGFARDKFRIHYQPVPVSTPRTGKVTTNKPLRILWASRVALQKNPELLVRITRKLDPGIAHINAFGRHERDYKFTFPNLPTLTYRGPFDGFQSLNPDDYDLLLYTSVTDGLPNVILEAAAAGLVIIASDAGGIGDFVKDGETGFLIHDSDNEDAYLEKIQYLQAHPELLEQIRANARQLLQKRHSWAAFKRTIRRDFQ